MFLKLLSVSQINRIHIRRPLVGRGVNAEKNCAWVFINIPFLFDLFDLFESHNNRVAAFVLWFYCFAL